MNFKIVCPLPVNLKIKITKTLFTVFELCSFLDKTCVSFTPLLVQFIKKSNSNLREINLFKT